ncbi:MAG: flagellar FliJ family protein [Sphingobacteriia bacterium]|nr:flagellar FliJ family protein [Sphingobacteriia bacterium]
MITKLLQKQLDKKSKTLNELNTYLTKLESSLQALKDELEKEKEACLSNPLVSSSFTNFLSHNNHRQSLIKTQITSTEQKIEEVKAEIFELFSEIKKYDVVSERKAKRKLEKEDKNEQKFLDDLFSKNEEKI